MNRPSAHALLDIRADHLDPRVLDWAGSGRVRLWAATAVRGALAWTRRRDWAETYIGHCPVEGAVTADYLGRFVDAPGGPVLAHIHFRGLDLSRPFVELMAWDSPLAGRLPAVIEAVFANLAVFGVRTARLLVGEHETWLADEAVATEDDQLILAGPLAGLRALPPPPNRDRVTLRVPDAGSFLADYHAMYDRLRTDSPSRRADDGAQPDDDVLAAHRAGRFLEALVDGEPAGYVAAVPRARYGLGGHEMLEELLDTPFRGHGLGAALQRALIDEITPCEGDLLFGTINPDNLPSRRTAERCGRVIIARNVFVEAREG